MTFNGSKRPVWAAGAGELKLRGLVLPVGGMKEKLLAAHTAGMSRVIVPARNMRDVQVSRYCLALALDKASVRGAKG